MFPAFPIFRGRAGSGPAGERGGAVAAACCPGSGTQPPGGLSVPGFSHIPGACRVWGFYGGADGVCGSPCCPGSGTQPPGGLSVPGFSHIPGRAGAGGLRGGGWGLGPPFSARQGERRVQDSGQGAQARHTGAGQKAGTQGQARLPARSAPVPSRRNRRARQGHAPRFP